MHDRLLFLLLYSMLILAGIQYSKLGPYLSQVIALRPQEGCSLTHIHVTRFLPVPLPVAAPFSDFIASYYTLYLTSENPLACFTACRCVFFLPGVRCTCVYIHKNNLYLGYVLNYCNATINSIVRYIFFIIKSLSLSSN